jgi:hypothetical protein
MTADALRRAEKALADDLPATNPLWKPWAMDLADDVHRLAATLRELMLAGAHEGTCTNWDDNGDDVCLLHIEAYERRLVAARLVLGEDPG